MCLNGQFVYFLSLILFTPADQDNPLSLFAQLNRFTRNVVLLHVFFIQIPFCVIHVHVEGFLLFIISVKCIIYLAIE